jgi:6-pyruvoyltetrahydropterin/6-carboxytetrahydropterin synthase
MVMDIEVDFTFSAAHQLPFYDGPCKRMHGHNYRVRVGLSGAVDAKTGMVFDFLRVKEVFDREIMPRCDHQVLNDIMENPTAENMIAWMWTKLQPTLEGLRELRLWENPEYCVTYRGK